MTDSSLTQAILKLEAAAYAIQLRHFASAVQLLHEAEQLARSARYLVEEMHSPHAMRGGE